jgi:hypothetical protein
LFLFFLNFIPIAASVTKNVTNNFFSFKSTWVRFLTICTWVQRTWRMV